MGLKFQFRYFNKVGATKVLCLTYVGAYAQFCKNQMVSNGILWKWILHWTNWLLGDLAVILKILFSNSLVWILTEITLMWMPQNLTYKKPTFFRVMTCHIDMLINYIYIYVYIHIHVYQIYCNRDHVNAMNMADFRPITSTVTCSGIRLKSISQYMLKITIRP